MRTLVGNRKTLNKVYRHRNAQTHTNTTFTPGLFGPQTTTTPKSVSTRRRIEPCCNMPYLLQHAVCCVHTCAQKYTSAHVNSCILYVFGYRTTSHTSHETHARHTAIPPKSMQAIAGAPFLCVCVFRVSAMVLFTTQAHLGVNVCARAQRAARAYSDT